MRYEYNVQTGETTEHEDAPTLPEAMNDGVKAGISRMEASITPRRLREALLQLAAATGTNLDFIKSIDDQIAALRGQL